MRDRESMRACDVRYLPIVSAYARTVGVAEEVDRLCHKERGINPGRIVLALMVDALSGTGTKKLSLTYLTTPSTTPFSLALRTRQK